MGLNSPLLPHRVLRAIMMRTKASAPPLSAAPGGSLLLFTASLTPTYITIFQIYDCPIMKPIKTSKKKIYNFEKKRFQPFT